MQFGKSRSWHRSSGAVSPPEDPLCPRIQLASQSVTLLVSFLEPVLVANIIIEGGGKHSVSIFSVHDLFAGGSLRAEVMLMPSKEATKRERIFLLTRDTCQKTNQTNSLLSKKFSIFWRFYMLIFILQIIMEYEMQSWHKPTDIFLISSCKYSSLFAKAMKKRQEEKKPEEE